MEQPEPTTPLPSPPLPPGAADVLRVDHPLLAEYTSRYRGHPAATSSQWSPDYISSSIDMQQFRGHSGYVWQQWGDDVFRYGLTTYFTCLHDRLGLFERLDEDGLFGAETYDIDGARIGRDLLDSITELNFLGEELDISRRDFTILDIGAGYGRLAHRATTAFANPHPHLDCGVKTRTPPWVRCAVIPDWRARARRKPDRATRWRSLH